MDGHEVLRRLRENDATHNTPIIAVSANAMPRDIEKGLEEGFDEYITKPIDAKIFLQTVEDKLKEVRT
jgi:CheY-like chemotaxis protein